MTSALAGSIVIVRAAVAPLNAEPRITAPQISQRLAGHPVHVLEAQGDWLQVRGEDGYEGWIHRGYLALDARGAPTERPGERALLSLGCTVAGVDQRERPLPLGAFLAPGDRLLTGGAIPFAERTMHFARDGEAITRSAVQHFCGTAYEWGGVTPWGADCSGLAQTVFWLHGHELPRDAWQQSTSGTEAGTDLSTLLPADLLFFSDRSDGRITHVALALGRMRLVHLALARGGYAIELLDDVGDPYVAALKKTFRFARRVIG